MVQLKVQVKHVFPMTHKFHFNSSMVQLKAQRVFTAACQHRFQFLYGTIKRAVNCLHLIHRTKFQFLYGTIKRTMSPSAMLSVAAFQFLYGTIKRNKTTAVKLVYCHFNSSMVQLKVAHVCNSRIQCYISIPLWYN